MLQNLDSNTTYCVSINQDERIDPNKVIARFEYDHPIYTEKGYALQQQQLSISGKNNTYFCGAYWGFGFHEDGVKSALHIADAFSVNRL